MHFTLALLLSTGLACPSQDLDLRHLTAQTPTRSARFDHTHALWSQVLAEHVRGERFDYRALKGEPALLERYLGALQAVTHDELAAWSRDQRLAFWINAYNAYTVRRVIEGYPVKSIKELGSVTRSVWDQRFIPLAQLAPQLEREQLSLNDIEHEILRPTFQDPRIHAAVNCAAVGCPRLLDHAYTVGVLDQQLDQVTRRWLVDPERNRFDARAQTVHLSRIFDWYGNDFGKTRSERTAWLARYAPAEHRPWLAATHPDEIQIHFLEYDWALNDAAAEPRDR